MTIKKEDIDKKRVEKLRSERRCIMLRFSLGEYDAALKLSVENFVDEGINEYYFDFNYDEFHVRGVWYDFMTASLLIKIWHDKFPETQEGGEYLSYNVNHDDDLVETFPFLFNRKKRLKDR